ncbi:MAG TPA: class A beta-lactamase [Candidatus Acidoferrales bacterium]|nr:class A beta-lactamase [Candidatus Acidoferrales bacterium]
MPSFARAQAANSAGRQIAAIEHRTGGRLGVCAIDTGTNRHIEYRAFEAFPMCSTFKLLLAGAILARVDAGKERLGRTVPYSKHDLLDYAPVTTAHVADGGMTVRDLCAAAIEESDNTAANLLLATLGGPNGLNDFIRSLGDRITQLDRTEPSLNEAAIGDPRDTTTPHAMMKDAQKLVLGAVLANDSRDVLVSWLAASQTGVDTIRAGVPRTWRAGDKSGSGERGTRNDVAILWPPGGAPIVIAAYLTGATTVTGEQRNAALASVGNIVSSSFS